MARFSKNATLMLYCCFRQAERSLDFALSTPSQWAQFTAYYDKPRRARIAELIEMLRAAGARPDRVPEGEVLAQGEFGGFVSCTAALLLNPWRTSWSFPVQQISYFAAVLEELLRVLDRIELPETQQIVNLRRACWEFHHLIGRKLIGIPELRKADSIEHFNQSEYVAHVTFEDMGIRSPQGEVTERQLL